MNYVFKVNHDYWTTIMRVQFEATDTHKQSRLEFKLDTNGIPIEVASLKIWLSVSANDEPRLFKKYYEGNMGVSTIRNTSADTNENK